MKEIFLFYEKQGTIIKVYFKKNIQFETRLYSCEEEKL